MIAFAVFFRMEFFFGYSAGNLYFFFCYTVRRSTLETFYHSLLGQQSQDLLLEILQKLLPPCKGGETALGLGYARFWLDLPQHSPNARLLDFVTENHGTEPWYRYGKSATALTEAHNLPLPNKAADYIVMQACLEYSTNPLAVLAEVSRVLDTHGTLVMIVPNRYSLWRLSRSPFGQGTAYSCSKYTAMLANVGLYPHHSKQTLFSFPAKKIQPFCEKFGKYAWYGFAGLWIIAAQKQPPLAKITPLKGQYKSTRTLLGQQASA